MSNEQTVREPKWLTDEQVDALLLGTDQVVHEMSRPTMVNAMTFLAREVRYRRDLTPDVSVSELQRRLRIADRVLSDPAIDLPANISEREAGLLDMGVDATLAWLTREDDQ